jgi:endonuclease/exonuclease/phosphatase family metal-dependent hydrolase
MGKQSKISIITWNVCFITRTYPEIRWNEILDICIKYKPNFILFQEVSKRFMKVFRKRTDYIDYNISDNSLNKKRYYWEMILEKKTNSSTNNLKLTSKNQRCFLSIHNQINFKKHITIGTFHLNSDKNGSKERSFQMKEIESQIKYKNPVILAGDFNFMNEKEANLGLSKNFPKFKYIETENTFSTITNKLAKYNIQNYFNGNPFEGRLDRILLYNMTYQEIKVIGKDYCKEIDVEPSDHYGIYMISYF